MNPTDSPNNLRLTQSLATVSGALAATLASSQGAVVQITLTGNQISTIGGNQLVADLTGDSVNDVTITVPTLNNTPTFKQAHAAINGRSVYMNAYSSTNYVKAAFADLGVGVGQDFVPGTSANIKYLNQITFTDTRINGGAPTQGYLEVNSFGGIATGATVALTRLVFDDSSTTLGTSGLSTSSAYTEWTAVPEPSGLALLALGAGGVLARRRRAQCA